MKNGPQIVKATSTNPLIDDLLYETEAKDTKTNVTSLSIKQPVGNIKSYLKWITLQLQNKNSQKKKGRHSNLSQQTQLSQDSTWQSQGFNLYNLFSAHASYYKE